jgi:phosphomevalonate kinase
MKRLLCISGKRFSGKDTFAALLDDHAIARGLTLGLYAFASESKRLFVEQQRAAGVDVDLDRLLQDRAYKESMRPALTRFTVESIAKDPLVFCRAVADRIERSSSLPVVTDLRLRLEVEHLRARFVNQHSDLHVVRLQRDDAHRAAAGWRFDQATDTHHTETELDDPKLWTEVVDNNGTPAELSLKAAALLDVVTAP